MTMTDPDAQPTEQASEAQVAELLESMLTQLGVDPDGRDEFCGAEILDGAWAASFEEQGLLTPDQGVVLRLEDGSEFQLTVRRSR